MIEHEPGELPVPRDRVLPGGGFGHAAERRARRWHRRHTAKRRDAAETERLEVRHANVRRLAHMPERVTPFVAIGGGIGQRTDTDAVEHEDEGAGGGRHGRSRLGRVAPRAQPWEK